jgi:carboxypeptidase C (cathepsin A)
VATQEDHVTDDQKKDQPLEPNPTPEPVPEPAVRSHTITAGGKALAYTSTAGFMAIRDEKGVEQARLSFTAYTLDGDHAPGERPLTIAYNGGPGSASVWLHLGGLGPKRVEMLDDGGMPQPPFALVDNDFTWLAATDIVFVDPVDTGYSRAASEEAGKKAKDVQGDLESVGEFIRLYLTRYGRWMSPLFLAGESYGTFRSAGLAGLLVEKGIAFNGIILISSILNMQTARFTLGNDLPYQLFFPTYAATAWYHKRVAEDLQDLSVREFLHQVEAWIEDEYVGALSLGARIDDERRGRVLDAMVRFTGLPRDWLDQSDLRVEIGQFCKQLLRDQRRTVGRLDSRFTGYDRSGVTDRPDYDPSMNAIRPPFTTALNHYLRQELGFESELEYHILRGLDWSWGDAARGYADTSDALRSAFAKNPYMKLFVASGYYDLATPYYATEYTLSHMALDPNVAGNIRVEEYPVGHMVYLEKGSLEKLRDDVVAFIGDAVKR